MYIKTDHYLIKIKLEINYFKNSPTTKKIKYSWIKNNYYNKCIYKKKIIKTRYEANYYIKKSIIIQLKLDIN